MGITTDFTAQKQIDDQIAEEIAKHIERVRALKVKRNAYSAINKIPEEVLLRIFLFHKLESEAWFPQISGSRRRWFTLMRVCSSWRNLVLECPHFWTHINASSPFADRMLSLAKGAPLDVVLCEPSPGLTSNERFWSFAAEIMARVAQVQELTIELQDVTDLSRLYSLSSSDCAPILETLSLTRTSPNLSESQDLSEVVWFDMPSLLTLFVDDIPSLPMVLAAPRLTTLALVSHRPISLSWVLGILQNSPLLESFSTENLGPEPPHFTTSPIYLPNIHEFCLWSKWFGAVNVFKYLRLPVTAALEVNFEDADAPEDTPDLSGMVSTFSRFTSNYSPSPLQRIDMEFLPSFNIYVYLPEDRCLPDRNGDHPLVIFNSPRATPIPIPITSYAPLCHALPLSSLHILALSGVKGDVLLTMALAIMKATIHIKTLELENFDIELIDQLFKLPGVDLPMNPELECLTFKHQLYDKGEGQDRLPVLLRLLRERRRLGIPITMVKGWCLKDVPTRMMKKLKRLVHVVDCEFD